MVSIAGWTKEAAAEDAGAWSLAEILAAICLVWYTAVVLVSVVGYTQLRRWYSSAAPPAVSVSSLPDAAIPHVTVIRPVKGLEPSLYDCLAATFRQTYPRHKLTVYFCVASRVDPAVPTLERLVSEFPDFDAEILVEAEDPRLQGADADRMGPNPKIRNMSRAYREARGDIVWILDCNVWIGPGVAGRMVDTLCGFGGKRPNKFVHLLPLVVDTETAPAHGEEASLLGVEATHVASTSTASYSTVRSGSAAATATGNGRPARAWHLGGGRLEELFMSSAHAKFYTAINTVLIAPCIVGKSNMFRRSHLDALTHGQGIDFFSQNICEDHLVGDRLWKQPIPGEHARGEKWGKHAMVFGDLAIQPMAGMSVAEYVARRVRWLRVRKFTVTLATLVEPGTESFLCSLYGAYAATTLPAFHAALGIPPTWSAFAAFWLVNVALWCLIDWTLYRKLHSGASIELDAHTPGFALPPRRGCTRRPFAEWLCAWLGREALAWPVWAWAVYGGVTVRWRGKRFWVGMDMKVHEIGGEGEGKRRD
ncbi:glycosyltransferase family 21 protein [Aplosporella prunicola CBS 121167]|uniref:Ceramide glucosyltransferase n=1 Tax=Aplosporella prunicola CBS 121167 TaxID=1176127 RepID=A0A6A6B7X6_9PEZI|nr:glycosyltransferase family 21 protein [Aplosporella prunicola CBS 121167]KAF2140239.1 glycosyltransferase family 21 protein [Aplosporella prunicola CBS 121167]